MILHAALELALPLGGLIPDVDPEPPPGVDGLTTLLGWISWLCLIAGFVGFLISAGALGIAHYTGRPVESFKGMAFAMLSAILVGSVGVIMRTFT